MKLWLILRAIALFGFVFSIVQAATLDIVGSITNVSADASVPDSSTLTATGVVTDALGSDFLLVALYDSTDNMLGSGGETIYGQASGALTLITTSGIADVVLTELASAPASTSIVLTGLSEGASFLGPDGTPVTVTIFDLPSNDLMTGFNADSGAFTVTAAGEATCMIQVDKTCKVGLIPAADACDVRSGGEEVTYIYEVANTGTTDIVDLVVEDDQLGTIPDNIPTDVLAPGETITLMKLEMIDQTTTNVVDVLANGGACGAVDDLTVTLIADDDEDDDNVSDTVDLCPNTVIPENAPTSGRLGNNRWALTTESFDFVQGPPQNGRVFGFSTEDTRGCSCEQIIDAAGLGRGHLRKGCSTSEMLNWINGL